MSSIVKPLCNMVVGGWSALLHYHLFIGVGSWAWSAPAQESDQERDFLRACLKTCATEYETI